jgi:hypothetical protein
VIVADVNKVSVVVCVLQHTSREKRKKIGMDFELHPCYHLYRVSVELRVNIVAVRQVCTQNFSLGGGAEPEAIYDFKNYVTKTML